MRRLWLASGLASGLFTSAGCDRPPSADSVPEWGPKDHHSQDDDKLGGRAPAQGQAARAPRAGGGEVVQLVELTWRQQCANCHGPAGKGDGPMGPMLNAPDLSRSDWQQGASDADIAAIIRGGKNRMPKYDLPDPVIQGLVAQVRSLRGR